MVAGDGGSSDTGQPVVDIALMERSPPIVSPIDFSLICESLADVAIGVMSGVLKGNLARSRRN